MIERGARLKWYRFVHEINLLTLPVKSGKPGVRCAQTEAPSDFYWWETLAEREGWAAAHVPTAS